MSGAQHSLQQYLFYSFFQVAKRLFVTFFPNVHELVIICSVTILALLHKQNAFVYRKTKLTFFHEVGM